MSDYTKLIKALRYHADATIHDCDGCPYQTIHKKNGMCIDSMISDAADALEAADKRIAELECQFLAYALYVSLHEEQLKECDDERGGEHDEQIH